MPDEPRHRCFVVACKAEIPTRQLCCVKHLRMIPPDIRRGINAALFSKNNAALHALDQARTEIAQREGLWPS